MAGAVPLIPWNPHYLPQSCPLLLLHLFCGTGACLSSPEAQPLLALPQPIISSLKFSFHVASWANHHFLQRCSHLFFITKVIGIFQPVKQ